MVTKIESASKNIAFHIINLRKRRNLSQLQLACLTGLTRASIALFESGSANPGLDSLLKLSQGLKVSIDELITAPRSECIHIKAEDVPVERKTKAGVTLRKLLPEKIPATEMDELTLEPQTTMVGTPHTEGTREYFNCLRGEFMVVVHGTTFNVKKGDVLSFPGDKPHAYKNNSNSTAVAISVVLFSS